MRIADMLMELRTSAIKQASTVDTCSVCRSTYVSSGCETVSLLLKPLGYRPPDGNGLRREGERHSNTLYFESSNSRIEIKSLFVSNSMLWKFRWPWVGYIH